MDKEPSSGKAGDFAPEMKVRILEGPFKDFRGTITKINPSTHKIDIAVNFFGKEIQAEFDDSQIAREP